MKVGRNDPCPCGSGKKHKKCCLSSTPEVGDLLWRQLRSIHDDMSDRLMHHARKRFGELALAEAWEEFWLRDEEEEIEQQAETQLFVPFYQYNWLPGIDSETFKIAPKETTVAFDFLERHRNGLTDLERRFLDQNLGEPFSFWEILEVDQGAGYRIKDCLRGLEMNVTEKSGSRSAHIGDILFGKAIQIDHVGMMCGCGWVLIPPIHKKTIIDIRKEMQKSPHAENGVITKETIHDFDIELRELFLELQKQIMTPPVLCNTDGEQMSLHKIIYDIDSPQAAFDALEPLALIQSREELLEDAEYKDEILHKVLITWHKRGNKLHREWDNTVMGRLLIEGNKLTVEVNSEKRAQLVKKEIEKRLKNQAHHRSTVLQSPESRMREIPKHRDAEKTRDEEEQHQQLMQHPEIQAQIREMNKKYWDNWFNDKIPALGNKTPLQASKSAEGKELLEALLNHYGRSESPMDEVYPPNWKAIRERLGLGSLDKH